VIVATIVAVTIAPAVAITRVTVTTLPNYVAAMEGGADVDNEYTINDIYSDSNTDYDSSSESDSDERTTQPNPARAILLRGSYASRPPNWSVWHSIASWSWGSP
jgi:hypothetical protein